MLFFPFLVQSFAVPVSVDLSFAFIIQAKLPQYYLRYSPPPFLHPFIAFFLLTIIWTFWSPIFFLLDNRKKHLLTHSLYISSNTAIHSIFWRNIQNAQNHRRQMHEHWATWKEKYNSISLFNIFPIPVKFSFVLLAILDESQFFFHCCIAK